MSSANLTIDLMVVAAVRAHEPIFQKNFHKYYENNVYKDSVDSRWAGYINTALGSVQNRIYEVFEPSYTYIPGLILHECISFDFDTIFRIEIYLGRRLFFSRSSRKSHDQPLFP